MLINALRSHFAEFGFVAAQGPAGVKAVIAEFHANQDILPDMVRSMISYLFDRVEEGAGEVKKAEAEIVVWCRNDAAIRRLLTIPRIVPVTASATYAAVPDPTLFCSGPQVAAWLGLTRWPHSSGSNEGLD